jgi:hypothetical protein
MITGATSGLGREAPLARRLRDTRVTANVVGPPRLTSTRFAHDVHPGAKVALRLASPFTLSPKKGPRAIIHLCSAPEVEGLTGTYWSGLTQPPLTPAASKRRGRRAPLGPQLVAGRDR